MEANLVNTLEPTHHKVHSFLANIRFRSHFRTGIFKFMADDLGVWLSVDDL